MTKTKRLYMENMGQHKCTAAILDIVRDGEKTILILDQTVFYPQGGGQPCDTGTITGPKGRFIVTGVHNDGATVLHEGIIESGSFDRADTVECFVEVSRRTVNSALHSAGHIIDIAVQELGLGWVPGKGYHFPLGPYIEYVGVLKVEDRDTLIKEIERRCRAIVESGGVVSIKINSEDGHDGRAERVVYFGDIGIPCGGTHIANLRDVGCIVIRKIKQEKGNIRVAYSVESH